MDARPVPWQDLQFFLAAARTGSLAGAASALGVSAATVHRRLAQLEKSLATQLFIRSPRGYSLTAAGSELLEHAQAIDSEVLVAERRLSGRDQRLAGTVHVATVDDLFVTVLSPVLRDFARQHPGVCLEVTVDSDHTDLARRRADVAIRPGTEPAVGDVIARRICGLGVALYASRDYLERHGRPDGLESLAAHRIVRADDARSTLAMERFIDRYVDRAATAFKSNSMLARVCAVRDGIGIGMLPSFIADADPQLVRIGDVLPEASAALWVLIHADMRRNARVRMFVDFVREELLKRQACMEGRAAV